MKNILFAVSEIEGLVKTGGLADVAKALPLALNKLGHNARIVIPYYQQIAKILPKDNAIKSYAFPLNLNITYQVNVHVFEHTGLTIYCVDIATLFDRSGIYGDDYHAFEDNGERFSVFSIAILYFFQHFATQLSFSPNIIHCNDWHTALIPMLFKHDDYWKQANCDTILTIHNGAFQGIFSKKSVPSLISKLGTSHPNYEHDVVNFLKLGIVFAGRVVAVSPNYAQELLTELGSHHLFDIFQQVKHKTSGILNGCDYKDWSPEQDQLIHTPYGPNSLEKKLENKKDLQQQAGLTVDANIPIVAQVCRLTDQKGLDYLIPALRELVQHKVQILVAGTGDPIYVDQLEFLAQKHPDKLHFHHGYSEKLAHSYMAGADYFLVPSLFEPCGLTQMYALAYGTLPIVREVGGLKDTVIDLAFDDATGVVFSQPDCSHLIAAIRRGLLFYREYPERYKNLQVRAMDTKFLWHDSANQYLELYETLLR
ncbi:glycogen synthase [Psychrosphaera sp. F3M07]|uniref:glycogen synthase n=1 Tax=Psychrosphaera sp. F3M07 TaxID=2841560 RepID=UPI001C095399|nr:glycogen synthase [Psychrosphaera sp. F3M07]MBU2919083.1 glycogen synthase [Psychrosphaera sp. F3M07]